MYKIVVLEADAVGDVSYEPLAEFGELILYNHTSNDQVAERIREADIVVPNKCLLNEDTMRDAARVKLICEAATGYNNIDIEYCKSRSIPVANVSGYSTESVVQHTFALLFQIAEHLDHYARFVESGAYGAQESFTCMQWRFHELAGKRFGVFGLGTIGRRVAEVAVAFGMEVVYYSASGHTYDVPYEALDWDEFLQSCDVISCHAPLTDATRGRFDADAFRKMKPSAVFLNLGRGPLVCEDALADALQKKEIAAAALDVFEREPLPSDSPLMQIRDRDRLFLTPHIAWAGLEARERLVAQVAENIRAWTEGKLTPVG